MVGQATSAPPTGVATHSAWRRICCASSPSRALSHWGRLKHVHLAANSDGAIGCALVMECRQRTEESDDYAANRNTQRNDNHLHTANGTNRPLARARRCHRTNLVHARL